MATGDLYRIFVAFLGNKKDNKNKYDGEGKVRYTFEVGKIGLGVVLLDAITSQYHSKSDYIKRQYYPIKDWLQAGLSKPSYIDIKSTRQYNFTEILNHGTHTGQLSLRDVQDLAEFIRQYRKLVE